MAVTVPGLPPNPRRSLRIGDADRDDAAERLSDHFVAGRLTHQEFNDRLPLVLQARTAADLDPLFADLPTAGSPPPARQPRPWLTRSPRRTLAATAAAAVVVTSGWLAFPAKPTGPPALPRYHCTVCVNAPAPGAARRDFDRLAGKRDLARLARGEGR